MKKWANVRGWRFFYPELKRLCENLDSTYFYNFCMVVIFFYDSYGESSDFSFLLMSKIDPEHVLCSGPLVLVYHFH